MFSAEKRRLRGNLVYMYKYLKGESQENGARLFLVVPSNSMKSSDHKLKHKEFHLNIRKNFFTLRVVRHWNRLPRELVESACLETLKTHQDTFVCHLLEVTLFWQEGWTG